MTRIILTILSGLILLSCKKEEIPNKGPICGDPSLLSISSGMTQLQFKTGTWWVFVDSVNLAIDSTWIYEHTHVTCGKQYCPDEKYEVFSFKTTGSGNNNYSIVGNAISRNQSYEYQTNANVFIDYGAIEKTFIDLGETMYQKKDSCFIYDRYYKNVEIVTKTNDLSENGNKTIQYINADFGFLKKEIYSSSNTLISKKVLKNKNIIR